MSDIRHVLDTIKERNIEYVDFRFTDTRGKWQHTSYRANEVDQALLEGGIMFDGSSIAGWKPINESDMILQPDASTAFIDPFTAQPTLAISCDIYEPTDGARYVRDPRSTAVKAEEYLAETGIADKAFFGPEAEFFVFDDIRFSVEMNGAFYEVDSEEGPYNTDREYPSGNYGHRPRAKGGYFPVPPVDSLMDIRAEMVQTLEEIGITSILHHHEVAPSQCEIGFKFSTLTETADNLQKYKYVVQNVAHSYGKTATFMPKPILGDNGSGMHVHQSLWKGDTPLFMGDQYAGLSETALYYIGGIIKHARAINAFSNASTNSYKRLVPGFEAPILLAYSSRNRSASIRIPHITNPKARRIEARFPDSSGNPYFTFAAMLMAGLDGIKNKIHPGDADERDLYALNEEQLKDVPTVCGSLRQALMAMSDDRAFLTAGGVFTDEQIDAYIDLKMEEIEEYEYTPHPVEFKMYYSV